jgi:hypothetical protein
VRRMLLAFLSAACGGGGGAGGASAPEVPENASSTRPVEPSAPTAAVGYLAAGTVGQNPDTGALEFAGNPLAVAWVDGELRPLAGPDHLEGAVAAFRDAREVTGIGGGGQALRVEIGPADAPVEGMFTVRLAGTVTGGGGGDVRTALLALPGVPLEPIHWTAAPVPDATAADQAARVRAALTAKPPYDECGDNTYDRVDDVRAGSGLQVGSPGPLAVSYKVTVSARKGGSTGEALSALFVGSASSVEPPYLGLCPDHPAWRADAELAVRIDRTTFLLVISACGCEQETWQLVGTRT